MQRKQFFIASTRILNEDNIINVDKTVLRMNQTLIILYANNENNGLLNSSTSESNITILTNKNNN